MIPEFGLLCLILALLVALAQVAGQFHAAQANVIARSGATAQFLCVTLAFGALILSHAESDFSVLNVVQNSHTAQPMIYKIAGAWGNHEGSMLLWVFVLSLFGFLFSWRKSDDPETQARTLGAQAAIAAGFLLFILLTSNPFARVFPPPVNGESLNPLLQDIGLALHPPMLYLGYVGNSMVFSLAVAALITGRMDRKWAARAQPWILLSWSILTVGIGLGSWWAYRELGWGGWWFWDPVENASLMPWLSSTALLHSNLVLERRGSLRGWVLLLAIISFSLSLLGTFLVRSGVLTSVHSFASDPARGMFILLYIVVVTGGALWLFAARLPKLLRSDIPEPTTPLSREGSIIANNLFLLTACATIVLATLYPLFLELVAEQKVSIGPPYFQATFFPIMAPLALLAAIGPLMAWKKANPRELRRPLLMLSAAAGVAALLSAIFAPHRLLSMLGMGLAAWLLAGIGISFARRLSFPHASLAESWQRAKTLGWRYYGMAGAHLGVAVFIAGVTGSSLWKVEREQPVSDGTRIENISGFTLTYRGEPPLTRPDYTATRGAMEVTHGEDYVTTLHPESRLYPVRGTRTSESSIYSTLLYDLYAVITPLDSGAMSARIYLNPLIAGVWGGFLLMAGGGILSIFGTGRRV